MLLKTNFTIYDSWWQLQAAEEKCKQKPKHVVKLMRQIRRLIII